MSEALDKEFEGLPEKPELKDLQEFFSGDLFAYQQAGCRILEGWKGHSVCEMKLQKHMHYNATDHVMGGAVFTLADYALGVASMCGHKSSVSVSTTIEYMRSSKGSVLIATCDADRIGRKLEFYTVMVTDDLGEQIAKMVSTCYHPV